MPTVQVNIRMSEDEKRLLHKQAAKQKLKEADYLRVCMIMDGVLEGDPLAFKITGQHLREKVGRRVAKLLGFEVTDVPVKA